MQEGNFGVAVSQFFKSAWHKQASVQKRQLLKHSVVKHAHASRIAVTIGVESDHAVLTISDDGRGFEVVEARERSRHQPSLGLIGMEERATLLGGSLDVVSRPGGGTEIRVSLPTQEAETTTEALPT